MSVGQRTGLGIAQKGSFHLGIADTELIMSVRNRSYVRIATCLYTLQDAGAKLARVVSYDPTFDCQQMCT